MACALRIICYIISYYTVTISNIRMEKSGDTISFIIKPGKREALDRLAKAKDRPRSYLLNEAVERYLADEQAFTESIMEGLRQAEAGRLVEHGKVEAWVRSWGEKEELPRPAPDTRPENG
jgi:predicted transcriptional regulator